DVFGQPAGVAGYDRETHGLRLDHGVAETFVDRCVQHDIRVLVDARDLLARAFATQAHLIAEPVLEDREPDGLLVRPVTVDVVLERGAELAEPGRGVDGELVALGPGKPPDRDDAQRRGCGPSFAWPRREQ